MGDHLVANEEAIKILTKNNGCGKGFDKHGRDLKRERHPPGND